MTMSAEYRLIYSLYRLWIDEPKILEWDDISQTSKTKKVFEWIISAASLTFTFD